MQQESRMQQLRQNFDPIDLIIEGIQLPAVMERIENERHQAKNVEVHRARRVPAACKNEKSDKEINQADTALIIFNRSGLFGRGSYQRSLKRFAVSQEPVTHLSPKSCAPQTLGYLHLPGDGSPVDGHKVIAITNPSERGGRIRRHLSRLNTLRGIQPYDPIVGRLEFRSLDEVQPSKNHGCQRGKR